MGKTLSIFCDESGDIGALTPHSPYYIVTLVFHDQSNPINKAVNHLEESLEFDGFHRKASIHTAPLIRRETPYANLDIATRRRLFSHLEHFMRHCNIRTKSFVIDKRTFGHGQKLIERLAREMGAFVAEKLEFFQSFEQIIIYYDAGQREVSKTLRTIFGATLYGAEFRTVHPKNYRLFQVADLVCTLELAEQKAAESRLSASEIAFFGNTRALRKNHLKQLAKIRY